MAQQRAVIDEEVLAWQLGITLAVDHGFVDRAELVSLGRAGLERYRELLELSGDEFDRACSKLV